MDKSEFSKIQKAAENLVENRNFDKKKNHREPRESTIASTLEENEEF